MNSDYHLCKFYDKNNELLYVATTRDFNKLLSAIKRDKHWNNEIDYVSKSEGLSARAAKEYKNAFVLSGKPKYNTFNTDNLNLTFTKYKYKV